MTEWAVIGVIITFVTFLIAVCKPLISLTNAITKLTVAVNNLEDKSKEQEEKAHDSHQKLWDYAHKQDTKIENNTKKLAEHDAEIKHLKEGG